MQLRLLGVRGSRPTHKRSLLGHGGNSTSFEIINDHDFYLFVDGGSGIVHRGYELTEAPPRKRFHCLVTHTHWDHILGYPFFEPLYNAEHEFTFYASKTSRATFNDLFFGLHRAGNLPVPISQMRARMAFKTIERAAQFKIEDKIEVTTFQLNHQGVTLGYRIEEDGASVCIVTDMAPIENGNYLGEQMPPSGAPSAEFEKDFTERFIKFLQGAHTIVYDTHFTEKNLKPDWGHSTPQRALAMAVAANVSRLILFHHAPEDTDDDVDDKVQSILSDAIHHGVEVVAAKEGTVWNLRSA